MKKSEYFNIIIDAVCEECEINRETLIKGYRMSSVVDARILAIQAMRRVGMTNDDIALWVYREKAGDNTACPEYAQLKSKARGLQKSFTQYTVRCEADRMVFCGHAQVIMWFIHEVFGVNFYGQKPKEIPEKLQRMIEELTQN